jgi:hypothetical protein
VVRLDDNEMTTYVTRSRIAGVKNEIKSEVVFSSTISKSLRVYSQHEAVERVLIGHDTAASIVCVKLEDVLDLLLCKDSRFRHFVKSGSVKRKGKGRSGRRSSRRWSDEDHRKEVCISEACVDS